jgi:hypothetical protein
VSRLHAECALATSCRVIVHHMQYHNSFILGNCHRACSDPGGRDV